MKKTIVWIPHFVFFIIYFLIWVGQNSLPAYWSLFFEQQGLTGTQIGLLGSASAIMVVVASLVTGLLGDILGKPRQMLAGLCGGLLLGTVLLYFSKSFAITLLAILIYGFCFAPLNGIVDRTVMSQLEGEHAADFGKYRMGGTIGAGVGILLAGLLVSRFPFSWLFWLYWGAALLCGIVCMTIKTGSTGAKHVQLRDYLEIIRDRHFPAIYLTQAVWGFTEVGFEQFLPLFVTECSYPTHYTSIFFATAMAGEALLFPFVGSIYKKVGIRKSIALSFVLQVCRVGSLALLPVIPCGIVILLQFIGGCGFPIQYAVFTQVIDQVFPEKVGYSAHNLKTVAFRGVGITLGSLLLGIVYQHFSLQIAYLLLTVVSFLSIFYVLALPSFKSIRPLAK